MAAASVYMRQVYKNCPDFSWRDYLQKLEKGKSESTEEFFQQTISAAYSSTMTTAVLLAVENAEKITQLLNTHSNFSL